MISDAELLGRFVCERSEEAFAELVRRHVDMVYAVALRRTLGNRVLAEDVVQSVFAALARKAGALSGHQALVGWLYRSARYAAAQTMRSEQRRRAREEKALAMHDADDPTDENTDWRTLRGKLDDILDCLGTADREAVVMRFYAAKPFAEIGASLRLSEDAARLRVNRALEKMRKLLARRGIASTAAALGTALASNATVVAPSGLGAGLCALALKTSAVGSGAVVSAGLFSLMSTTKVTVVAAGVVVATAIGIGVLQTHKASYAESARAVASTEMNALQARTSEIEADLARWRERALGAERDSEQLLAAIQNAVAAPPPGSSPDILTEATVMARYNNAENLARNGDHAAALREYLWCYDEGMVRVQSMGAARTSLLLGALRKLAEVYSPAREALVARRDKVEQAMLAEQKASGIGMEFAALNGALGENQRTLDYLKALPAGDLRRETMSYRVIQDLVSQKRYREAADLVDYSAVVRSFESRKTRTIVGGSITAERAEQSRRSLARTASGDVEILAGAGELDKARDLIARILEVDRSEAAVATLRQHLDRAGQSHLLGD